VSSSMSSVIDKVWAEISRTFRSKAEARVVVCNTRVVQDLDLAPGKPLPELCFGGGTDLRPGFEALTADPCDLIIVATDGYTPWPSRPVRGKRTIVLLTPDGANGPAWSTNIVMK